MMKALEFVTDSNGKLSSKRLAGFIILGVASYVMIVLVHRGEMEVGYFAAYIATLAACFGVCVLEKRNGEV